MTGHDDMPRHDDPTELEPRPRPLEDSGPTATVAQLRQDIVSGTTGEKVAVLDPSMASLGTDDEAAGEPPSPELVAAVRNAERTERHSPLLPTDGSGDPRPKFIGAFILVLALVSLWLG